MNSASIPILDLKAQYLTIKDEITSAIDRVLDTQQFILGPEVDALEKELANYCHSKFAFGVSSGTDALLVALMAIGIKQGDEVITTPYSFFSTAGSIARLGGRPVFVDIDPDTFNIQTEKIEQSITSKTKAILPVHLAGQSAKMDTILGISEKYNLYVIEDACQAIGADYNGSPAGSMGHIGCFSFFPSKNLGGYGDSGLITTNDPVLADKVALIRNHGQRKKYHNELVGGNFRMDALQAAILRVKLSHLEDWTKARRNHAAKYRELFEQKGISIYPEDLDSKLGLVLPLEAGYGRHIYHLFMIRTRLRDELAVYLRERKIGSEIYYPLPLHLQECFQNFGFISGDFPNSEQASNETLAIPVYPELTDEMILSVVDTITAFYKSHE